MRKPLLEVMANAFCELLDPALNAGRGDSAKD